MQDNLQEENYQNYLMAQERQWESQCLRCGACCGAYEDPCKNLKEESIGKYFCNDYAQRYGSHETVGGKKFHCMPIRDIIHMYWDHDQLCAYKKSSGKL